MNSDAYLASTLNSLKFISSSSLHKIYTNTAILTKIIKEFKLKLIESLDSNQLSDKFLINLAECLYDLKACDSKTNYHLSKTFETRSGIISSQLKGGVLWVYFNNPSLNRYRRKIINASCRVAIKQATKEFLELKENVTNISRFDSILRNLKIIGDCYKLPVSPKIRLEHAILESSEILKLSLECFPLLSRMCSAFCSLLIDNEKIGSLMIEIFSDHLQNEDILTLNEICSLTRVFYKWKLLRIDKTVRCIEILTELVERDKFNLTKNPSNTVKFFTSIVRLPRSELICNLGELILNKSVGFIESFCNNSDLVLFFNSVSHFKKAYPNCNLVNMDSFVSNLETFLTFGKTGKLSYEYDYLDVKRNDIVTINRSCNIVKECVNVNKLLDDSRKLLELM